MTYENLNELYWKLKESYSESNLHKIAHNLIRLYREKEYEKLQIIAEIVYGSEQMDSVTNKQGFSKLISVYHPDRIQYYHNELEKYVASRDPEILHRLEHLLLILNIEEIVDNIECFEDIDYCPEFKWDVNEESFTYFTVSPGRSEYKRKTKSSKVGYSFFNAIKIRMYGDSHIELPSCWFENRNEIEMAESQINDLDGIEYCIHTETLDLSGNRISDLSPLWGLTSLKDLNLADNRIYDIGALGSLTRLRSIDLSNNPVADLSPLFNLGKLQYIDLTGNKKLLEQVGILVGKGVIVNRSGI